MISALVFSKDRAAQLDLLLYSVRQNAAGVFNRTDVIWTASSESFADGYRICADSHRRVRFHQETNFRGQVLEHLVASPKYSAFLCDDDVFYRGFQGRVFPDALLAIDRKVLTVSLRLGENTTYCYPLRQSQSLPEFRANIRVRTWDWTQAQWDFGYPGSLDGNVWRTTDLLELVGGEEWDSPNILEAALHRRCAEMAAKHPLMCCYDQSFLVGNPTNSVQTAVSVNRHGESHPTDLAVLNSEYLCGRRLAVPAGLVVDAAHVELPMEWV